jgi:transposase
MVELRDMTRRRKKIQGNLSAEKNRIQEILETANVKIGNIVSDVFGVSGQAMVSVLLRDEEISAEQIANLSRRRLRQRIPELTEALKGHRMNEHRRWLIQQSVEHAVLLDRQLEELETRIAEKLAQWREQYEHLQTIPGVKEMVAACILAEVGPDMSTFESAKHLCSWAGICPGNNRSAGKSKSSRIKKANRFLLAALVQAGWAAARKNNSLFQRKFHRWMNKLGEAKANIAIAHSLLETIYAMLKSNVPYQEREPEQLPEMEKAKLVRHHAKRLRQLGADEKLVAVMVEQIQQARSPSPEEQATARSSVKLFRSACPAKVCRGALGFRARTTRKQEYSVEKDPSAGALRQGRSPSKSKSKPKPSKHD